MKSRFFYTAVLVVITITVAGCASATPSQGSISTGTDSAMEKLPKNTQGNAPSVDHHEGETDVAPHGHSSSHDDTSLPPHRD